MVAKGEWNVVRDDGSVFTSFPTELLAEAAAESWNRIMDRERIARHYSVKAA